MSGQNNPNARRFVWGLIALSVILALIDFVWSNDHPHFDVETWPLFYGAFGFASFVFLVYFSKYILRPLVSRKEDYYDS